MTPTMFMEGELEVRAWARVAKMITINSRPYILFRPTTSARAPNPSCPTTVPAEVATLMAVSEFVGMTPLDFGQYTTPNIVVRRPNDCKQSSTAYSGAELTNTENIIGICEETNTGDNTSADMVPDDD
jgi:hypothetical protein